MENQVARRKERLRSQCRSRLQALGQERRRVGDRAVFAALLNLAECTAAQVLHTYVSIGAEVDTRRFIDRALAGGRQVVIPVVHQRRTLRHALLRNLAHLRPGPRGLLQPDPDHGDWLEDLSAIDAVLVPGLAFDRNGRRLGQGGGYYDRFLAQVQAAKIGLARADSIRADIPVEAHDIPMDIVVAEAEIYRGEKPWSTS